MIKVTVLLKDDAAFQKFLKTNKVEEYTWKKGDITIDLTNDIKESMQAVAETPKSLPVEEPAPVEQPVASSGSGLF